MRIRDIINIVVEAEGVSIKGRYSADTTEVYTVRSRAQLDMLLKKYGELRASMTGDRLDVWDSSTATHHDYESTLGTDGARLMIMKRGIEYNIDDITPEQILKSPIIRKLCSKAELSNMNFTSNEC